VSSRSVLPRALRPWRSLPLALAALAVTTALLAPQPALAEGWHGLDLLAGEGKHRTDDGKSGSKKDPKKQSREQLATLEVLPPIAQVGPAPAAAGEAETVLTATFQPARQGRPVVLTVWKQRRWEVVGEGRLDRGGRVEFTAPSRTAGEVNRYRVTAPAYQSLDKVSTRPARTDAWGAPDFLDEFSGAALDWRWGHRIQFLNPWGGRSCSLGSPDAVGVEAGALRLSAMADAATTAELGSCYTYDGEGNQLGTTPYPYRMNGHISTENVADFRYGVAAARMKFHEGKGSHASFWLQPRGLLKHGTTPWGAEIDVVEWFGASEDGRGGLVSTVYRPTPEGAKEAIGGRVDDTDSFLDSRSDRWWRNYHVFSVEWTPEEYVFRVDGRETWRTSEGVSHHEQFLILSQLTSDYELAANPTGAPQHTYVDWVQFWRADAG
jgi:hypothetical protein